LVLKILLGIWMSAVIMAAFLFAPAAEGFRAPEAARIIFFHVPNAVVASIAFVVSMVYAIRYLKGRNLMDDAKSSISAELGLVFTVLATVTGSLFAHVQWGSWWNWDTREIAIVMLLLVYAAYFALRSATDGIDRRARLSAVFAIVAVAPMVFLMFVMPRVMVSLHPAGTLTRSEGLSPEYRMVLFPAMLGFLGLYVWIFRIKTALAEFRIRFRRY
jgi:heme exporter protein C